MDRLSFAAGWAIHGPLELSDSARALCASTEGLSAVQVFEIAKYEGLLATLEARRLKLSKRWKRRVRPIVVAIAAAIPTEHVIAHARHALADHPDDSMDGQQPKPDLVSRTRIAKGVALVALRKLLADEKSLEQQWTELVSLAEAEGAAEGIVQADAMLAAAGIPVLPPADVTPVSLPSDLNDLYDRTLASLRQLDSYGQDAPAWISQQLDGLAGDMGRAIADGIANNVGRDELLSSVNDVIDKGAGAELYMDESIHHAMQRAALAQMSAAGLDLVDYIAMPDACSICAPLDSSIAGPYSPGSCPAPPQHPRCRCTIGPAGTVSS